MPQLLLCIPLNRLLRFVCGSFLNSYLATYIHDRLLYTLLYKFHVPYLSYAYEEQCHLLTLLCILSYNELHYLTNLLFFIKKCSTYLAQKHMPHMTHSHQYHMIHFERALSLSQLKEQETEESQSLCKTWKMR